MLKKHHNLYISLIFVFSLMVSCTVIGVKEYYTYQNMRERARYVTNSQVSKLQYVLNTLFMKTQTLEMLVMESNGDVKEFEMVAKNLLDNKAIRSLQLAPQGNVTMVYPLEGNEEAFGDIFSDPDRATEAIYARDSGKMTLSGPFDLYQGGLGAVARRPIYIQNEHAQKTFWGFSILVLDLPDALYPAELDKFAQGGYAYQLHRIQPDSKKVQVIDASTKEKLINPLHVDFEVPNGTWTFSVAPTSGWFDYPIIILEIIIAIVISTLASLLIGSYLVLRKQKFEMQNLSLTDSLTGLYNRRMLSKTLNDLIADKAAFVLLFLDFDGFKTINDTFGHNFGDLFLKECAIRLASYQKENCFIFRNGGDEFSIIITKKQTAEQCETIAKTIQALFNEQIVVENERISTSISIGYSIYPEDAQTTDQILHIADQKMYTMKKDYYMGKRK